MFCPTIEATVFTPVIIAVIFSYLLLALTPRSTRQKCENIAEE
jgi:hypothetical protein